jgi:hypothetical protein
MALLPCPECQKDVSDKALACPHCGIALPRAQVKANAGNGARKMVVQVVVASLCFAAGAGAALAWPRHAGYAMVEQLRGEQDADGTHTEKVRQRFYRLFKEHPQNAMYIYLWARCVDEPAKQLELAQQGIRADPHFSWNYNMAARALARLERVAEAYEQAQKGAALDPGNLELDGKQKALKLMLDRKLSEQPKPAEGPAQRYLGLFRSPIHSPDAADLQSIKKTRLADYANPVSDAVRGFVLCANPYADACLRAYVPRDARFKAGWPNPTVDVAALHEHELVAVTGSFVTTGKGEGILLADTVTVEPQ